MIDTLITRKRDSANSNAVRYCPTCFYSIRKKKTFFAVKKTSPGSSNKLNAPVIFISIALNFCYHLHI